MMTFAEHVRQLGNEEAGNIQAMLNMIVADGNAKPSAREFQHNTYPTINSVDKLETILNAFFVSKNEKAVRRALSSLNDVLGTLFYRFENKALFTFTNALPFRNLSNDVLNDIKNGIYTHGKLVCRFATNYVALSNNENPLERTDYKIIIGVDFDRNMSLPFIDVAEIYLNRYDKHRVEIRIEPQRYDACFGLSINDLYIQVDEAFPVEERNDLNIRWYYTSEHKSKHIMYDVLNMIKEKYVNFEEKQEQNLHLKNKAFETVRNAFANYVAEHDVKQSLTVMLDMATNTLQQFTKNTLNKAFNEESANKLQQKLLDFVNVESINVSEYTHEANDSYFTVDFVLQADFETMLLPQLLNKTTNDLGEKGFIVSHEQVIALLKQNTHWETCHALSFEKETLSFKVSVLHKESTSQRNGKTQIEVRSLFNNTSLFKPHDSAYSTIMDFYYQKNDKSLIVCDYMRMLLNSCAKLYVEDNPNWNILALKEMLSNIHTLTNVPKTMVCNISNGNKTFNIKVLNQFTNDNFDWQNLNAQSGQWQFDFNNPNLKEQVRFVLNENTEAHQQFTTICEAINVLKAL